MRSATKLFAALCLLLSNSQALRAADTLKYSYVTGAGGVPLSVAQIGDPHAPAILFIHGLGQSHLSFAPQLHSALAERYHLIALDLRGHGNSGKPWDMAAYADSRPWADDVQAVMQAMQLDRPVIVAWSFGTLVTADYVRQFGSDRLRGIVMCGAPGGLVARAQVGGDSQIMAKLAELRRLDESPGLEDTLAASRAMVPLLTARPMPPEWTATAELVNALVPPYARPGLTQHLFSKNVDIVTRIHVPMLLIGGGEDKNMPEAIMRSLSDALPLHATVKVYEGVGHSTFAEQPERFNADVDAFMQSLPP